MNTAGRLLLAILLLPLAPTRTAASDTRGIAWVRTLTADTFTQAARDKRLVILDLEAVWCHWCHVMNEKTYSRPAVIESIASSYIPVRIDQDSRPDLGNRYREYGWPATIIFNAKGEELEKLAGFVEPEEMEKILRELAVNPAPRKIPRKLTFSRDSRLSPELRSELFRRVNERADFVLGGLKTSHKFLDPDTIEHALKLASQNDASWSEFAKKSLNANTKLFDPVWGGVYQYSTFGDWEHPHYEKLVSKQAENIRLYSLAYALWKDPAYLRAIRSLHGYLNGFLRSPEGAYYTSQDADLVKGKKGTDFFALPDADRRKLGLPAIDKNIYASENGRIISALADAFAASGDRMYLDDANRAAAWVVAHRSLPGGGYMHGEKDLSGPYLCDSLYMGEALLKLYSVTGDRKLLKAAEDAASFIGTNFGPGQGEAGLITAKPGSGVFHPLPVVSENIAAVRYLSALGNYSGNAAHKQLAAELMRYLATKEVALETVTEIGIVTADEELSTQPTHVTVIGDKEDPTAAALFKEALAYPAPFKRSEWWDRREGPMPNADVQYPPLPKSAAFVCTNKRCSLPIYEPEKIAETIRKLSSQSGV